MISVHNDNVTVSSAVGQMFFLTDALEASTAALGPSEMFKIESLVMVKSISKKYSTSANLIIVVSRARQQWSV